MAGAVLASSTANADTRVDNNHVRVEAGDSLYTIAQHNGTDIDTIAKDNNLTDPNMIHIGDVLVVTPSHHGSNQTTQSSQQVATSTSTANGVTKVTTNSSVVTSGTNSGAGSVHDQFIAAGGTESMWQSIVMPESGGNPNAVSPNGYSGLGQTMESWGTGSVADQTKGMINYANSRYGSLEGAVAFRQSHGWW